MILQPTPEMPEQAQ